MILKYLICDIGEARQTFSLLMDPIFILLYLMFIE